MIEKIHIQNFKSIYDLELEVGRVNLFIGENGSGKSNLLEALVFVSASESNMLANEFLHSRGLRVPEPELMRSAFDEEDRKKDIKISIIDENKIINDYDFSNTNQTYSKWDSKDSISSNIAYYQNRLYSDKAQEFYPTEAEWIREEEEVLGYWGMLEYSREKLLNFIIYSPEYEELRNFTDEGQIQPLGVKGEGLYKLLKVVNNYEDKSYIKIIIESLQLFDWFENIIIPDNLVFGEKKLVINDKYLYTEIDQRSTNEGFLFILFYVTLIVSKETPKAFAIDNIDSILNPKLCTELMRLVVRLAKKYDKQIFLTTHNPAILDGMNLNDEEQKLFVVSRKKLTGYTRTRRITVENKPKSATNQPLKLSEAFLRGYLGGLPKGF